MTVLRPAWGAILLLCVGLANGAVLLGLTPRVNGPAVTAAPQDAVKIVRWETVTVTQDFLDDLKAGKPRSLTISLRDAGIEEKAEILRQQRHVNVDDSAVREMKREAYAALKRVFLNRYSRSELAVGDDLRDSPQLILAINSVSILYRLSRDRFVARINSPLPYHAAGSRAR